MNEARKTVIEFKRRMVILGFENDEEIIKALKEEYLLSEAELLHTSLCLKSHNNGECHFYDEDTFTDKWDYEDHKLWLDVTMYLQSLNVNPTDVILALSEVTPHISLRTLSLLLSDPSKLLIEPVTEELGDSTHLPTE